jgi:hypothetical protein
VSLSSSKTVLLFAGWMNAIVRQRRRTEHLVKTGIKHQWSIVIPAGFGVSCFAISPDSKQLVHYIRKGRMRILQTDDFSVQRDDLDTGRRAPPTS